MKHVNRTMKTNIKIFIFSVFLVGGLIGYAQSNEKNSLRNPISQYYLTDLNLRHVAKLIVEDSIQPMDNNVTFSILDSVTKGNLETRNYFAKAFDVIIIKSDGALSEVIGVYCMKSIYNHPNELLNWLSTGKMESTHESIAGYIAYELVMSDEPEKEKENLINRIKLDAVNSSTKVNSEKFIALIEEKFEQLIDE